jgi:glycosyltransferase involved in cell wall biosynthesis
MAEQTPSREVAERPAPKRDTTRIRPVDRPRETDRLPLPAPSGFRVVVCAPLLDLDGTTLYTRTVLRALRDSGDRVMLVSPGGPLMETLNGAYHEHAEIPADRKLGLFARRNLRNAVDEFEPDLIHAVMPDPSLPAVRLANQFGCPLAVSVHGVKPDETPAPDDQDYDAYIASDHGVRQVLLNACSLDRDRTTLVPNCVYPERKPLERDFTNTRRRPVVGWIGPLTAGCGYHCFIEAAMKIQGRGLDTMFSILGSGPEARGVRDAVEERGMLQRIVVVDGLFDYSNIWSPFDIVVVDSRQQASELMVLHAMANGRPVVATEGNAIFGVIDDGVDGVIVPRDDPDTLAERLLMLVQNPAERFRMGLAGFTKIEEQYRPPDMAAAINLVYSMMLKEEPLPKSFETARVSKRK